MRILIHGLNYSPELTGIGKYTGEMAKYFSDHGHEVRVITAPPYYPQWDVHEGYSAWKYSIEQHDDIDVYRCPLWVPSRPSGIKRIVHLISFAFFSFPVMIIQIFWKPELIIGIAPTLLSAFSVLLVSRFSKSFSWLHIQDFELDAAFELDLLPGRNTFFPIAQKIETSLLRKFNRVSTISHQMLARLHHKGLEEKQTNLIPNWVNVTEIYPLNGSSQLRIELGIEDDQIVVLYSGNMGFKQGLEILISSAKLLNNETNIIFVLCGDGIARSDLEEQSMGLSNIRFLPLQPVEKLNNLLNLADIHVLPQRAGAADLVMPSKLSGMLASGRPVIVTADEHTELSDVVNGIGYVVEPGDERSLAEKIKILAIDKGLRHYMGALGREYVEVHWSKDVVLGSFQRQLEIIVENSLN